MVTLFIDILTFFPIAEALVLNFIYLNDERLCSHSVF